MGFHIGVFSILRLCLDAAIAPPIPPVISQAIRIMRDQPAGHIFNMVRPTSTCIPCHLRPAHASHVISDQHMRPMSSQTSTCVPSHLCGHSLPVPAHAPRTPGFLPPVIHPLPNLSPTLTPTLSPTLSLIPITLAAMEHCLPQDGAGHTHHSPNQLTAAPFTGWCGCRWQPHAPLCCLRRNQAQPGSTGCQPGG